MPNAHEFIFTHADFERVRRLIYQRSGIVLNANKRDMVYVRLSRRLRALHFLTFAAYLDFLSLHAEEMEHFVNSLTTNLTAFFREEYHFPILASYLQTIAHRPIRLWSAATSSGEEAYSMAMVAFEALGVAAANDVRLLASDIDSDMLETAKEGIYTRDRIKNIAPQRLHRFFLQNAKDHNVVALRPEVRHLVHFEKINLLDPVWPFNGQMDVVFCRNVMIYFDRAIQKRVLKHLLEVMRPGALFFAGHSENLFYAVDRLEPLGQTVYRVKPPT